MIRQALLLLTVATAIALAAEGDKSSRPPRPTDAPDRSVLLTGRLLTALANSTTTKGVGVFIASGGGYFKLRDAFETVKGVVATAIGYTGGFVARPRYEEVCLGRTGHSEAVLILYNKTQASYADMLRAFWGGHDSERVIAGFNENLRPVVGTQYRSAVYVSNKADAATFHRVRKQRLNATKVPIQTKLRVLSRFWVERMPKAALLKVRATAEAQVQERVAKLRTQLGNVSDVELAGQVLNQTATRKGVVAGPTVFKLAKNASYVRPTSEVKQADGENDVAVVKVLRPKVTDAPAGEWSLKTIVKKVNQFSEQQMSRLKAIAQNQIVGNETKVAPVVDPLANATKKASPAPVEAAKDAASASEKKAE